MLNQTEDLEEKTVKKNPLKHFCTLFNCLKFFTANRVNVILSVFIQEQMDCHLKSADISLSSVKPGFDSNSSFKTPERGSKKLNSKDDISRDEPQTATVSATEAPFGDAAPDALGPPATAERLDICPHVEALAGDTRLIPFRPKTPIMADRPPEESREEDSQQVKIRKQQKDQKDPQVGSFLRIVFTKSHSNCCIFSQMSVDESLKSVHFSVP